MAGRAQLSFNKSISSFFLFSLINKDNSLYSFLQSTTAFARLLWWLPAVPQQLKQAARVKQQRKFVVE